MPLTIENEGLVNLVGLWESNLVPLISRNWILCSQTSILFITLLAVVLYNHFFGLPSPFLHSTYSSFSSSLYSLITCPPFLLISIGRMGGGGRVGSRPLPLPLPIRPALFSCITG